MTTNNKQIKVGDRVEGGTTKEDYEQGQVVEVDGDQVTVMWDQGVRTTQDASLLTVIE